MVVLLRHLRHSITSGFCFTLCIITGFPAAPCCGDDQGAAGHVEQGRSPIVQSTLDLSRATSQAIQELGITPESVKVQIEFLNRLKQIVGGQGEVKPHEMERALEIVSSPDNFEAFPNARDNALGFSGGDLEQNSATLEPQLSGESLSQSIWRDRSREEQEMLIQTYSESFLPGYEKQVQSYFKRLAELSRRPIHMPPTSSASVPQVDE